MQCLMTIQIDQSLLDALPVAEYDRLMRGCILHADALRAEGKLLASQQLEAPATACTLRQRDGAMRVTDGPFAETKELLAGFNLLEVADMDEAVRIASAFPWSRYGSVELRPVRDFEAVRARVGA